MKTYTVLLLRPDYISNAYGADTYMTHFVAASAAKAEDMARAEAHQIDTSDGQGPDVDPLDYAVLMVIEGKHMDIKTS